MKQFIVEKNKELEEQKELKIDSKLLCNTIECGWP